MTSLPSNRTRKRIRVSEEEGKGEALGGGGAHSFAAGLHLDGRAGVSELAIMNQTGQRSLPLMPGLHAKRRLFKEQLVRLLSAVKRRCRVAYTRTCRSRQVELTPAAHLPL